MRTKLYAFVMAVFVAALITAGYLFFAPLNKGGILGVASASAQGSRGAPLGWSCDAPGQIQTATTENPDTGKANFLKFTCAYSDPGKGWRWALIEPYKN